MTDAQKAAERIGLPIWDMRVEESRKLLEKALASIPKKEKEAMAEAFAEAMLGKKKAKKKQEDIQKAYEWLGKTVWYVYGGIAIKFSIDGIYKDRDKDTWFFIETLAFRSGSSIMEMYAMTINDRIPITTPVYASKEEAERNA